MSAVNAQQDFKNTINALINKDHSLSVNIDRYQSVLEHELSKRDLSIGLDIYILPINLNLKIRKTASYNNKVLISSTDMKITSKRNVSKAKVEKSTQSKSPAGLIESHAAPKMYLISR